METEKCGCGECQEHNDACCGSCCHDHDDAQDEPIVQEPSVPQFPKTVEKEGTGYEKPLDDCVCVVDYTLSLGDKVIESKNDFKFVIGDLPVICDGFEKGVESMKLNEVCSFTLKAEDAFGDEGDKTRNIPPKAEVSFKVTLKSMESVPSPYTIAPENIVKHAEQKKIQGNELVKRKMQKRALRCYLRGLEYLDNDYRIPDDQKEASKKIQLILYSNVSAMYLHLKQYDSVIEYCDKVTASDEKNLKALLRRGKAYLEKLQVEKAQVDFNKVLEIDPNNKEVKLEMSQIKKKQVEADKKDKQRYARMFSALGSLSQVEEEQKKRQEAYTEKAKKEWEQLKEKETSAKQTEDKKEEEKGEPTKTEVKEEHKE
ncbi:FK506-binding protein, putative [Entamoeba invadens IP1]|uniref:FK506-binding protein, putative n=1 Tax=Entamoeba invadens IP1 TaxID=370355 RepID=UPI0002C3D8D5|nr:FK506-binding protein, putative [Entamoeba invadens IP1]ELP93488.1 FK506-binding protein, putative [Entamoeba invadens IP1]|eukprot:XP_004260259.1 FK506-binding protein, putative [Entamoeba invadens IP1]